MSNTDNSARLACFSVVAFPDPSVMSRVLQLFAKRGIVPTRFTSTHHRGTDSRLVMDIQMAGIGPELAAYLGRCMAQITCVESVETCEAEPETAA
ncbi:MAG: hypothetical protein ACKVGZ_07625 [Alphaproteobacteria bacterium]